MPLNLYAIVNGFTTQEGTGDASPSNVREIENAGEYTNILTFDGEATIINVGTNTKGLYRITIKTPDDFEIPDAGVVVDAICNQLKPVSATAAQFSTTYGDFAAYNGTWWFFVSGDIKDIPSAQEYLSNHPIIVAYKSTQDTGKFYTGIEVEQGDEYRCEIIELQAPLHEGDMLQTNVESECNQEYVFTGAENFVLLTSLNSGLFQLNGFFENAVANSILCSDYFQSTAGWTSMLDGSILNTATALGIRDTRYSSVADFKDMLVQRYSSGNPVRIFYNSASGGILKNIKREEYTRRSRVLTGTEAITATTALEKTYFAISAPDAKRPVNTTDVLNIKSNMFSAASQNALIFGDYRICVSGGGNFLLYFNETINTVNQVKQILSEKYMANTPVTIEYELAQPEVFADDPIDISVTALEVVVSGEGESKITYRIEPKYDKIKTDWKVQPPTSEGYYNGDWFELEDYVRIYNNLQTVKDLVKSIYGDFTFPTMITPVEGSPVFASQINILEEAIRAIRNKSIAIPEIPDPKTWTDNANLFTYEDINRWESVAIYYTAILMGVYELQPKLQFKLGGAQF